MTACRRLSAAAETVEIVGLVARGGEQDRQRLAVDCERLGIPPGIGQAGGEDAVRHRAIDMLFAGAFGFAFDELAGQLDAVLSLLGEVAGENARKSQAYARRAGGLPIRGGRVDPVVNLRGVVPFALRVQRRTQLVEREGVDRRFLGIAERLVDLDGRARELLGFGVTGLLDQQTGQRVRDLRRVGMILSH